MEYIDGFTIRGCHVYHNYMEGLNVKRGARNGVIEGCTLYANDLINIYHDGASNVEIRYNRIYDCTYNAGIELGLETNTYGNDTIRIHHNLFWGNAGGVSFWAASGITAQTRNISICNNTFYNNDEAIRWKSGATNHYSGANVIKNNLFWQKDAWNTAIKDYTTGRQGMSGTSIDYNVFQQGAASDTLGDARLCRGGPVLRRRIDERFSPAVRLGMHRRRNRCRTDSGLRWKHDPSKAPRRYRRLRACLRTGQRRNGFRRRHLTYAAATIRIDVIGIEGSTPLSALFCLLTPHFWVAQYLKYCSSRRRSPARNGRRSAPCASCTD